MLNHHTHKIGCPCGHLDDIECIRHRPLPVNPCDSTGNACRDLDLVAHRRHTRCPFCIQAAS